MLTACTASGPMSRYLPNNSRACNLWAWLSRNYIKRKRRDKKGERWTVPCTCNIIGSCVGGWLKLGKLSNQTWKAFNCSGKKELGYERKRENNKKLMRT